MPKSIVIETGDSKKVKVSKKQDRGLRMNFTWKDAISDRNGVLTMASGVATTRLKKLHFINWLN